MSADRRQRAATAGLSAVGATAGAAGLGLAGNELREGVREAPKGLSMGRRLVHAATATGKRKFATALIPLEIAGLAGEVTATHILHGDTKRKQPQGVTMVKSRFGSGGASGHRITEEPRSRTPRRDELEEGVEGVAKALEILKREHPDGNSVSQMGVDGAFHGQAAASHLERAKLHRQRGDQLHMEAIEEESALKRRQALAHHRQAALLEASAKQRTTNAVHSLGLTDGMGSAGMKAGGGGGSKSEGVKKARRFDPEADRQRRLGAYSGLAGGAAIVAGDRAARDMTVRAGKHGLKFAASRRGLLLGGAALGLAGAAGATYRRGISARNQPWD